MGMSVRGGMVGFAVFFLAGCVGDAPVVTPTNDGGPIDGSSGDASDASVQQDAPSNDAMGDATGTDGSTTVDGGPGGIGDVKMWFAADTNVTLKSGKVASWASKAGLAITLNPDPGAGAPYPSTLKGLPSIYFDGTAGSGTCPCPSLAATIAPALNQPLTVFAVIKSDRWTDGTHNYDATVFTGYPTTFKLYNAIESGPAPMWALGAPVKLLSIGQTDGAFRSIHLVTAVFSGGASVIRLDGANEMAGPSGGNSLGGTLVVGTDGRPLGTFQGHIGELVFYARVLSSGDRDAVENYLKTRWSIP